MMKHLCVAARMRCSWIWIFGGAFAVCALSVSITVDVEAQRTFFWSKDEPDVGSYAHFRECLAHKARNVAREKRVTSLARPDTMPPASLRVVDTLPTALASSHQLCAARFSVESEFPDGKFSFGEAWGMVELLLAARRDAEAEDLVARWIASVRSDSGSPPFQDSLVAVIAEGASQLALDAHPRRLKFATSMMRVISDWRAFYATKARIMIESYWNARALRTDSIAKDVAAWLTALPGVLRDSVFKGDSVLRSREYQSVARLIFDVYARENASMFRDSLRVSDEAYQHMIDVALNVLMVNKGNDQLFDARTFSWSTEKQADTIVDVFHTYPAGVSARPSRGKIALVVRLGGYRDCYVYMRERCLTVASVLRRVQQRFPTVEIDIIDGELGYFGGVHEPTTHDTETALLDSLFMIKHRMPGTLLVFNTPFVRLPEPDGRRINTPSPNDNVRSGFPTGTTVGMIYVVTDRGRKVKEFDFLRLAANPMGKREFAEEELMLTLEALMVRAATR